MGNLFDRTGSLRLGLGAEEVTLYYRRPEPAELIDIMVRKMPRGNEAEDARSMMLANLDLGKSCLTGLDCGGAGPAEGMGGPQSFKTHETADPLAQVDWKDRIERSAPLLLVALGQHLSAPPAFIEEGAAKKS